MSLAPGTRLGPYEIHSLLGAGGMGEVYQARDTRLGRRVAIKVLPAEFASDADRLRRFEREARSASALSDPHIVAVYDVGEANGAHYFACELVEGSSLRELMGNGPVPTKRVVELAEHIATGLAAAHEKGIVHRDLKPENILLTRSGEAKIADFGLAKLTESGTASLSELPTSDGQKTSEGVVMGTVSYMSPEQARGAAVDFRSDQFSLGTILYEMMAGRRPFQGPTAPQTLSAIIEGEPPPIAAAGPEATLLRWTIERLLAKNPEERFSSTKDLVRDLKSIRERTSQAGGFGAAGAAPAAGTARRSARWILPVAAALAGAIAIVAFLTGRSTARKPTLHYEQISFRRGTVWNARFSPDGQTVLYSASFENNPIQIFEKHEGGFESRPLGLAGDDLMSVSRSGSLAVSLQSRMSPPFQRSGTLAETALGGTSAPRALLENVYEADWGPDSSALAIVRKAGEEFRLEYPPGNVLYRTAGWLSHARVSPDGKLLAFLDHPALNDDGGSVGVVDLKGHHRTLATNYQTEEGLAWSRDGREVWFSASLTGQNTVLYAVTLDGRIRTVDSIPGALRIHDVSRDGHVLATRESWRVGLFGRPAGLSRETDLSWLDWSLAADISNDGKQVLFSEAGEGGGFGYSVYLRKGTEPAVRLGEGFAQSLSPDGASVVAILHSTTLPQIAIYPTGVGQSRLLPPEGLSIQRADWMPDGRHLLVSANEEGKDVRLWIVDSQTGKHRPVSPEGFRHFSRCILPDGSRVIAGGPGRKVYDYPLSGGAPTALPGLTTEDLPVGWLSDGRSLLVLERSELPARILKYDTTTGKGTIWKELYPPDPTGIIQVNRFVATPDGAAYVYNYQRYLSELFEIDGLK